MKINFLLQNTYKDDSVWSSGFNWKGEMYGIYGEEIRKVGLTETSPYKTLEYTYYSLYGVTLRKNILYYLTYIGNIDDKKYCVKLVSFNLETGESVLSSEYIPYATSAALFEVDDTYIGVIVYQGHSKAPSKYNYVQLRYIDTFEVYKTIVTDEGSESVFNAAIPTPYFDGTRVWIPFSGSKIFFYNLKEATTSFIEGETTSTYFRYFVNDTYYTAFGCTYGSTSDLTLNGTSITRKSQIETYIETIDNIAENTLYNAYYYFGDDTENFFCSNGYNIYVYKAVVADSVCTINSTDGKYIAEIGDYVNITSVKCDYVGNSCTVTLNDSNSVKFTIPTVEGRAFTGLSLQPNSKFPLIQATGITKEIYIEGSVSFYLTYSKPSRPITEPFEINLYQNKAATERVDKTGYLTEIATISGVLRNDTSITKMTIALQYSTTPNFNYCYIAMFGRWYYVTDCRSIRDGLWEIDLSVDVLMTYKDSIYECKAFIDRNENIYNKMIVDSEVPLQQGQTVTTTFIDNDVYVTQGQYVLTGLLVTPGEVVE